MAKRIACMLSQQVGTHFATLAKAAGVLGRMAERELRGEPFSDDQLALVGKVLHVGTGYPRMMVVTVETCQGPRAYTGVVYAYHELVTDNFQRLSDQEWAPRFRSGGERPTDVSWLSDLLAQ